ncbi:hypothetical protein B0T14DRAFT_549694 [Immersiella caudata]|uniref:Uncharacterized protein n=1 Tax=Immersiella caudata TaxID=314043 RepID=A0AA39XDP2_9PEZI|nr:hypothetical protein B0T14DRAFT_549694 [Immersiella caudata]
MNAAGPGPGGHWLSLDSISSDRTKTLALGAFWNFTSKGAASIIRELERIDYKDATFIYDPNFKWIEVTCLPEDEDSVIEEFEFLAKIIERKVFRSENKENLFNTDGTLKATHESSERRAKAIQEIERQLPGVLMQCNLWRKNIYVASNSMDDMCEAVRRFEIFLQATDVEQEDEEDRDELGQGLGDTFHVVCSRGGISIARHGFDGSDAHPLVCRMTALCSSGTAKTTLFDPTRVYTVSGAYRWMYRRTFVVRQVVPANSWNGYMDWTNSLMVEDRDRDKKVPILFHDGENMSRPFPNRVKDGWRPPCSRKQLQVGYNPEGATSNRVDQWLAAQVHTVSIDNTHVPPSVRTRVPAVGERRGDALEVRPGSDCSESYGAGAGHSDTVSDKSIPNIPNFDADETVFPWVLSSHAMEDVDDAARRVLRAMPYKRGNITMRAELGRILSYVGPPGYSGMSMGPATGSSEGLWKRSQLTRHLLESQYADESVHFTKILTTYAFEIKDVLNFKIAMFQSEPKKPRQWDSLYIDQSYAQLVYSFFFRRGDEEFVIDVEDTGKHDRFTYSIHTHNGFLGKDGRKHDVRIVLMRVDEEEMEERFGAFAREFFKSLKITFKQSETGYVRDKENPLGANRHLDVRFQVPGRFDVEVTAARVLTTWRCDSSRPQGAFLEVTEVEQLDMNISDMKPTPNAAGKVDPGKLDRSIRAFAWSDELRAAKKDMGEFPVWYEVSVGSHKLEEAFMQNKSLKLGEKASWDASEFICEGNAAFYDMYAPALEMARQLQQLGQYSDNGQDERYNPWHSRPPNLEDTFDRDYSWPSPLGRGGNGNGGGDGADDGGDGGGDNIGTDHAVEEETT